MCDAAVLGDDRRLAERQQGLEQISDGMLIDGTHVQNDADQVESSVAAAIVG
jgi:hypothetical protein